MRPLCLAIFLVFCAGCAGPPRHPHVIWSIEVDDSAGDPTTAPVKMRVQALSDCDRGACDTVKLGGRVFAGTAGALTELSATPDWFEGAFMGHDASYELRAELEEATITQTLTPASFTLATVTGAPSYTFDWTPANEAGVTSSVEIALQTGANESVGGSGDPGSIAFGPNLQNPSLHGVVPVTLLRAVRVHKDDADAVAVVMWPATVEAPQ